jgi:hypothetical protein
MMPCNRVVVRQVQTTKFGRLCYVARKCVNVFGGQNCEPMGELVIQAMPQNVGIVSQ